MLQNAMPSKVIPDIGYRAFIILVMPDIFHRASICSSFQMDPRYEREK